MTNPESGFRSLIETKPNPKQWDPKQSRSFLQTIACDHLMNLLPFDFSVVLALDVPELWAPHDAFVHGAHGQVLVVLFRPRYNIITACQCQHHLAKLKGVWHEIFDFRFFHESVSHWALSVLLINFKFLRKVEEIFATVHRCQRHRRNIIAGVVVTGD